jgi:hypothetical protein
MFAVAAPHSQTFWSLVMWPLHLVHCSIGALLWFRNIFRGITVLLFGARVTG